MAVANTISNIFCGIIKDKMTNIIEEEELIGEEQNGFRKDRRGTENSKCLFIQIANIIVSLWVDIYFIVCLDIHSFLKFKNMMKFNDI